MMFLLINYVYKKKKILWQLLNQNIYAQHGVTKYNECEPRKRFLDFAALPHH